MESFRNGIVYILDQIKSQTNVLHSAALHWQGALSANWHELCLRAALLPVETRDDLQKLLNTNVDLVDDEIDEESCRKTMIDSGFLPLLVISYAAQLTPLPAVSPSPASLNRSILRLSHPTSPPTLPSAALAAAAAAVRCLRDLGLVAPALEAAALCGVTHGVALPPLPAPAESMEVVQRLEGAASAYLAVQGWAVAQGPGGLRRRLGEGV